MPGCAVLLCLVVCLTLLALSLKHVYSQEVHLQYSSTSTAIQWAWPTVKGPRPHPLHPAHTGRTDRRAAQLAGCCYHGDIDEPASGAGQPAEQLRCLGEEPDQSGEGVIIASFPQGPPLSSHNN